MDVGRENQASLSSVGAVRGKASELSAAKFPILGTKEEKKEAKAHREAETRVRES